MKVKFRYFLYKSQRQPGNNIKTLDATAKQTKIFIIYIYIADSGKKGKLLKM